MRLSRIVLPLIFGIITISCDFIKPIKITPNNPTIDCREQQVVIKSNLEIPLIMVVKRDSDTEKCELYRDKTKTIIEGDWFKVEYYPYVDARKVYVQCQQNYSTSQRQFMLSVGNGYDAADALIIQKGVDIVDSNE